MCTATSVPHLCILKASTPHYADAMAGVAATPTEPVNLQRVLTDVSARLNIRRGLIVRGESG